jgi:predicted AlkP superfamily phosphohydrolase/phosphomutase
LSATEAHRGFIPNGLIQEIAADVLKDNDVDPEKNKDQLEALIKVIKKTVNDEKARIREEKAAWKKRMDSISPEKRKALDELQIWKYYPQNKYPDVSGNKVPTTV